MLTHAFVECYIIGEHGSWSLYFLISYTGALFFFKKLFSKKIACCPRPCAVKLFNSELQYSS
jgi:hypothetical protein